MNKKKPSFKVYTNEDLQTGILNGLNVLTMLIKQTYGPNGKNIIFDSNKIQIPELSKEGNFIIKNFLVRNKLKNIIILLIEETFKTLKSDGTNTFFLISSSMIIKGIRFLALTPENLYWCDGMQKTIYYVFLTLETNAKPLTTISDLDKVIRRFLPGEKNISLLLKDIFTQQNLSNGLEIELNVGGNSSLIKEPGMKINYGYHSPYFLTDTNKKFIELLNPYVLITNYLLKLDNEDFAEWLEPLIYLKRPLLLIAPEIEEDLLSTLILNKLNGIIEVAYIQVQPNLILGTSSLEDIAIYTNGKIIKNDQGWKKIKRTQLGEAKKITITNTKTVIIRDEEKPSSNLDKYYDQFHSQALLSQSEYEREKLLERQKNFLGTKNKLQLGGATLLEAQELKKRIENSLIAVQNCLDEGTIDGGAKTLVNITEEVENWAKVNLFGMELIGSKIVINSIQEPIKTLLNNDILNQTTETKYLTIKKQQIKNINLNTKNIMSLDDQEVYIDSFTTLRKGFSTSLSLALMLLSIKYIIY